MTAIATDQDELKKLQRATQKYIARWVRAGGTITSYACDHCQESIPTIQPSFKDVGNRGCWDSLMTCTKCLGKNFVQVFPNGITVVVNPDAV